MNLLHFLLRLKYRVNSFCVMTKYRLLYPHRINTKGKYYFRKGLALIAEGNITIGNRVFFNNFCSINSKESVFIDDECIFGENVHIYDHNHLCERNISYHLSGYSCAPVHIGKHCWISSNCIILKGVSIGDNCIIGAGVVVYKDVPANTVVINHQNIVYRENS